METLNYGRKVLIILLVTSTITEAALKDPAWKHCMHNVHAFPGKWGSIKTPGFPNGISTQIQCSWIIQSNPGYKVKLAFHTLNMTGSRGSCFTQFVEILDYKVGHSMGKFCGTSRPGDYVSYGYRVRFDLQGDTSGKKTKGCDIRYKAVKEAGGFKNSWSVGSKTAGKSKGKNLSKARSRNSNKRKPPSGPAKVFGRNPRKKSESVKPSPKSESGDRIETSDSQVKPSRAPPPSRIEFRSSSAKRTMGPVIYGANNNARAVDFGQSDVITQEPESSDIALDYTIIAGIAAGGAVLLVIIIVVIKLCVCDKAKRKRSKSATAKTLGSQHHAPGYTMVPIPGMVPGQYAGEEVFQRNPPISRLHSWAPMQPTMSHSQYPATLEQFTTQDAAQMPHIAVRSSGSRTAGSCRSQAARSTSKTYASRSKSSTRQSRHRDEGRGHGQSRHARSRSLCYLPANIDGWIRVDDVQSAPRRKRPSDSDVESSDVTSDGSSYTESDSTSEHEHRERDSRKTRSTVKAKHGKSLNHDTRLRYHHDNDMPPPYYIFDKGRDFDEGYDTSRKAANKSRSTKSKKSHGGKKGGRKSKRSRKYSY